jgi:hypothetical protein
MSELSMNGSELLAWNEETLTRWLGLFEEKPELLALPCDIAPDVTHVGQLMQHIVAVELRYALRLIDGEPVSYDQVPTAVPQSYALRMKRRMPSIKS